MFEVKDLSIYYGSKQIVENINFEVKPRDWFMVLGPNGVGKSSIVNAISGSLPYEGVIEFRGQDINQMRPKIKAQNIGILTQHHSVAYHYSVEEVISLGRYAYRQSMFSSLTLEDEEKIEEAIQVTGLSRYRYDSILSLSGGEQQRVYLAQVIAQNPNVLILDEPANHLDLAYQEQIFQTIHDWLQEGDRCVISIIHDLSVAKYYGNRGILLYDSETVSQGEIDNVLESQYLEHAYKIDVKSIMKERYSLWT